MTLKNPQRILTQKSVFIGMGSNNSHVAFESDGHEGVTFVKGIRVSARIGGGRKFNCITNIALLVIG